MIKINDGTQTKRIAGKTGDRTPQTGLKRGRAVYVANGGETSIDLSSLSPQINYMPGSNQISVKRSSLGSLISGFSFFERDVATIGFSSALIAGERVEIIKEIEIVGIQAATPRPDIYTAYLTGETSVTVDFSWPYNLNPTKAIGGCEVYLSGMLMSRGQDYSEVNLGIENTNKIEFLSPTYGNLIIKPTYQFIDQSSASSTFLGQQLAGIQDLILAGSQGFVDTKISTTLFTSSIINREKINLDNNLKVSFGVERVMTPGVFEIQNEFGPNGEPVFGAINDNQQLIRLVGSGWKTAINASGPMAFTQNINDYVEIVFYGNGLNILMASDPAYLRVSINGFPEGPLSAIASQGGALLLNKGYSPNIVCPAMSGGDNLLINVVKIRLNQSATNFCIQGFEIINSKSSSDLTVNKGTSYLNCKKYALENISNISYNLNASGTKGGRSVVYLSSDGSIKSSFRAVDSITRNMDLAHHANEEIAKTYFVREFGNLNSVSIASSFSAGSIKYTLDDNLTTLNILNGQFVNGLEKEAIACRPADGKISFTFIGTGLDIEILTDSSSRNFSSILLNGLSITSTSVTKSGSSFSEIKKIVSGLPYGTHTVIFSSSSINSIAISKFIVYQPLKPSIPATSLELADYNLMAQYSLTSSLNNFSYGVVGKSPIREMTYDSSSSNLAVTSELINGSVSVGSFVEYTFFGSGVDLYLNGSSGQISSARIIIDGSTYTQQVSVVGTNCTWNPSSGTISWSSSASRVKNVIGISGLPLKTHTIKIIKDAGSIDFEGVGVLCPIHSHGTNLNSSFQNTLHIGNNSLNDLRKISMVKNDQSLSKSWAQANQITSSVTNTSLSFVPCQNLSCSIKTAGKPIQISYSLAALITGSQTIYTTIYLNGIPTTYEKSVSTSSSTNTSTISDTVILQVPSGFHKIDVYWKVSGGTGTAINRNLTVVEI